MMRTSAQNAGWLVQSKREGFVPNRKAEEISELHSDSQFEGGRPEPVSKGGVNRRLFVLIWSASQTTNPDSVFFDFDYLTYLGRLFDNQIQSAVAASLCQRTPKSLAS
jgi:hypothetical protein